MPRVLSENTRLLIESLYKPVPLLRRSTKHKLATLGLIGQARETAAIPDIAPLLMDGNKDMAQATARVVSSLGALLKPGELPWLDQVMRDRSPYRWSYPSAWADLKPGQLDKVCRFLAISTFPLGLASFHFNGHVRESAVRPLGDVFNGTELPFLLLRLNDWVPQVRGTAGESHTRPVKGRLCLFLRQQPCTDHQATIDASRTGTGTDWGD